MKRLLVLCLSLILVLSGCSKISDFGGFVSRNSRMDEDAVLNLYSYIPNTLNPYVTNYDSTWDMLRLIYDSLFETSLDMSAVGVLASGYTASENNTVYTVTLEKAKFHGGKDFTADDVIASVFYAKNYSVPYSKTLAIVKYVERISDDTVVFRLSEPNASFVNLLDFPIMPANLDAVDFDAENTEFIPIGTGKYKIQDIEKGKKIVLMRNDERDIGELPLIKTIEVSLMGGSELPMYSFNSGSVDIIDSDTFKWGDFGINIDYTFKEYTSNNYEFIGINHDNVALDSANVRNALNYALDKKHIADNIKYSHVKPVNSPVNPDSYFSTVQYDKVDFDLEQAKSILEKDGWLDLDGDGVLDKVIENEIYSLSFDLIVNSNNDERIAVARYVAEALRKCQMNVSVTALDFESYNNKIVSGSYDLFIGGITIPNDNDLRFMLKSTSVVDKNNHYNYLNTHLDAILDKIALSQNSDELISNYGEFQNFFENEFPHISLYFENDAVLCNTRIKPEISLTLSNVFGGIQDIFIEKDETKE